MTALAWIVLAAIAVASIAYMAAEHVVGRETRQYLRGYKDGRDAERRAAGRLAGIAAFERMGKEANR